MQLGFVLLNDAPNVREVSRRFVFSLTAVAAIRIGIVVMPTTINATDTIKGCFLISVSTKSGTTGVLYSAGLFTGGDQPVVSGNTLTVSYTGSV